MWSALKQIGLTHRKKLLATFSLVALENLLFLGYPIFGGLAIDAVIQGNAWLSLIYGVVVLLMWLIGALRRAVDTRTFTQIYTQIAVPVILKQRQREQHYSAISARVALSREFVNFFEEHLPTSVTSLVSVFGAIVMLLWLEFWVGILACGILAFFLGVLPRFANISEQLYFRLNNRLERDVHYIQHHPSNSLWKHYQLIARLRVLISNREAMGYFAIGIAMSVLFGFSFFWLSWHGYGSAGHIYSISTYLWMFAMSLDDMPRLIEHYSNLKDIAQRVEIEKE